MQTPALVASGAALLSACGEPPHPPAPGAQGTPQVEFKVIEPQRLPVTTELPGRIAATKAADVRPQVNGLIRARLFTEGSEVRAGQVLYRIDDATYRASVGSAQAALAKAEANLVSVRLKAGRYAELSSIKAVSQQDADDAAASMKQAEADVASARAMLETDRINLAYTRVTAPIGGNIGRSSVTVGALVTASQTTALATVQQLDPIYVDVTQSSAVLLRLRRELALGSMKSGTAQVKLLLEDGSMYSLPGRLQFSEVTVDQNTGAVTLRAEFPNPKGELLPGMYVRAVVEEGVRDAALLAPQVAVTRDAAGQAIAFVVGGDSKLEQRTLTTERAIGDQWLVSAGLNPGDHLVVQGQDKAKPGAAVEAKPYVSGATVPASAASGANGIAPANAAPAARKN